MKRVFESRRCADPGSFRGFRGVFLVFSVRPHQAANESYAVRNLTRISAAEVTYKSMSSSGGRYGTMQDLIAARLLDETFTGIKGGNNYAITLDETGQEYTTTAVPMSPRAARYAYFNVPDAMVRYSTDSNLAPYYWQAGKPVRHLN